MPVVDLAALTTAVQDNAAAWTQRGITWQLHQGPAGANPHAAWVDFDTTASIGRLILWDIGNIYLEVVYFDTDAVRIAHHELSSPAEVETWVATLARWVLAPPPQTSS